MLNLYQTKLPDEVRFIVGLSAVAENIHIIAPINVLTASKSSAIDEIIGMFIKWIVNCSLILELRIKHTISIAPHSPVKLSVLNKLGGC